MSPSRNLPDKAAIVRVLIADADPDTRSLYEDLLTGEGYTVVGAEDGRDALVNALSEPPTLVITETRLPALDGYDLCDMLRRDSMTETVPILVVTSETRIAKLHQALASGADAVLNKPVTPEALLAEVQRLLAEPSTRSASAPQPERKRRSQVKAHVRVRTTTPPAQPPSLLCPWCDRRLYYEYSHVGGVNDRHAEQWDAFTCPSSCGRFEYRQRTRKLRRVGEATPRARPI